MSRFLEALHSGRVLLMDGAMGTELIRRGLNPDQERCEQWNLTRPEEVTAVHREYGDAGALVYVTNTFQAHVPKFREAFDENQDQFQINIEGGGEECAAAVRCARAAGAEVRFLVGSVGPLSSRSTPFADSPMLRMRAVVLCALQALQLAAETDAVVLETQTDLPEVSSILAALRNLEAVWARTGRVVPKKPLFISVAFHRNPRGPLTTSSGESPEGVAARIERHRDRVTALGVNCGRDIGFEEILEILNGYRRATNLPLFARPNAGTPTRTANGYAYPLTPEKLAARLPELLKAGIAMFGGCCGTTPAHIAACRPIIDEWNREHAPAEEG